MTPKAKCISYWLILTLIGGVLLAQMGGSAIRVVKIHFFFNAVRAKLIDVSVAEIQQFSFGEHGGMETAFVPKITYEYEVAGRQYSSSRYCFTGRGADRLWAEKVANSYVKGYDIHVLYDPGDPGYSVMTRDVPKDARGQIVVGVIGGLFCLVSAGIFLWRLRRPAAEIHET